VIASGGTAYRGGVLQLGEIGRDQVWRHTLSVPGTYRYACLPHHGMFGMTGTVKVGP
jgi:plastocyanin